MSNSGQIRPTPTDKLWTPANVITLVRICLVPVFVIALISPWPQWFNLPQVISGAKSLIAAGIFILISCTDWLDGYLARSRNEVTDFGKFMDPLADKILVCAALLVLIELGLLPSWVVLVIMTREFIVAGVRMMAAREGVVIAASWYGKAKTVTQMIAIVLFTIKDSHMVGTIHEALSDWLWVLSWIVMIVALVLTVISMLDYIAKARHLIGLDFRQDKAGDTFCDEAINKNDGDDACPTQAALENLAASVLDKARKRHVTLGSAESLTGGLICAMLTEIPGSSDVVRGSIVSYASEVKEKLLGVDLSVLTKSGVVSEATVIRMAKGAREKLNCDIAVSVSGIAGPDGAEPNNPVGSVWFACVTQDTTKTLFKHFSGTRTQVRIKTLFCALNLVWEVLDVH